MSTPKDSSSEIVSLEKINLSAGELEVSAKRTDHLVALRPACEQLGIDADTQARKLHSKHWATTALKTVVAADGKARDMLMVTRDTFTMWLATIEPSRVNAAARERVIVFQKEAVAALDSYFHEGGAINPRATEEQRDRLVSLAESQMRLLKLAEGIVDPAYLDSQARIVLGEGLGREAELDPMKIPLEVDGYLKERGVKTGYRRELRAPFGTRLAGLYFAEYGAKPMKAKKNVAGGIRPVNTYTQEHRYLFDRVFDLMGISSDELALV